MRCSGAYLLLMVMPLSELLTSSDTLSFLVIKDGKIGYERYFGDVDSRTTILSYSVTKSFVGSLLAIACNEGLIARLDDPIGKYLPELPSFVHAFLWDFSLGKSFGTSV